MSKWNQKWQELVTDLERERDELKLKIKLGTKDAHDQVGKLDEKIQQLKIKADAAASEAKEAMEDVGDVARKLADEIKSGFERVRKTL
jgi:predicted  nucleic acid-binding Zn-ribbon protein